MKKWSDLGLPRLTDINTKFELSSLPLISEGKTKEEAFEILSFELLGHLTSKRIITPIATIEVRKEFLEHLVEKRKDSRERYAKFVYPTLEFPYEIWELIDKNGTTKHHYISLFNGKNDFMVVVIYRTDGTILWNMMHATRKKMNSHRKGMLIYTKRAT